jgi:hypothetical protein
LKSRRRVPGWRENLTGSGGIGNFGRRNLYAKAKRTRMVIFFRIAFLDQIGFRFFTGIISVRHNDLLHRGFINQDLILLRVEPHTPKNSFCFRCPARSRTLI